MSCDILTDKTVVTRKSHRCFGCLKKFPANTKMRYRFQGGCDAMGYYTCRECDDFEVDLPYEWWRDLGGDGLPAGWVVLERDQGGM